MRVLGIDPGLRRLGWGIIDAEGSRLRHVANGVCESQGGDDLATRLLALHRQLTEVLTRFAPQIAANPIGHAGILASVMDHIAPALVAIFETGEPGTLTEALHCVSLPGATEIAAAAKTDADQISALGGKSAPNNQAAAFACLGTNCSLPITDPETLRKQLAGMRRTTPKQT